MKEYIFAIGLLIVVSTSGCLPFIAAGVGIAGTIYAGRVKHKGDLEKAKAIEDFRDIVVNELDEINKGIEEEGI
jgi:hypothetical protein